MKEVMKEKRPNVDWKEETRSHRQLLISELCIIDLGFIKRVFVSWFLTSYWILNGDIKLIYMVISRAMSSEI